MKAMPAKPRGVWEWGKRDCVTHLADWLARISEPSEMREPGWWLDRIGGHPVKTVDSFKIRSDRESALRVFSKLDQIRYCRLAVVEEVATVAHNRLLQIGVFGIKLGFFLEEENMVFFTNQEKKLETYGARGPCVSSFGGMDGASFAFCRLRRLHPIFIRGDLD